MYIPLLSIVFVIVFRFLFALSSLATAEDFCVMFSRKGYVLKSYDHQASSRLSVTVSSASNSESPSNLYGFAIL